MTGVVVTWGLCRAYAKSKQTLKIVQHDWQYDAIWCNRFQYDAICILKDFSDCTILHPYQSKQCCQSDLSSIVCERYLLTAMSCQLKQRFSRICRRDLRQILRDQVIACDSLFGSLWFHRSEPLDTEPPMLELNQPDPICILKRSWEKCSARLRPMKTQQWSLSQGLFQEVFLHRTGTQAVESEFHWLVFIYWYLLVY